MLFAILLLHAGLILFAYVPVIPTITASLGLIILGLLFYEIYKKYRDTNFAKYLLLVFVVILGLLIFSQIEYIPSKNVVVVDVFDKPIENVAISVTDYVGDTFSPAGGNAEYRFTHDIYSTDKNGSVITKPRFYFGERKAKNINVSVNTNVKIFPKSDYDSKGFSFSSNKNYKIVLAPMKGDYRNCNTISDIKNKSECLLYTSFYTAVKEKNPELCKLYDDEAVRTVLYGQHSFYLSREDEVKNECLIFVGGVLKNNSQICSEVKDGQSREFNKQCEIIFSEWEMNKNECDASYRDECKRMRLSIFNDTHNYLCEGRMRRDDGGIVYKNSQIRYLDTVSDLYRNMFCN